jgi:hypothetical protein
VRRYALWAAAGAILVVLTAFAQDSHDEPETFDSILNVVIRASRERLRPLKTFRIEQRPGTDYWYEVTETLPGAECRILEHPRMVYQCTWTASKKGGPAGSEALMNEINKAAPDKYVIVKTKRVISFEPREPRRYPPMEIAGERSTTPGMQLRIYAVPRD